MNGGSDPKPYHFLKECNKNFQMYVNCFDTDLVFLLRSAQNFKTCTFLDNLRTIAQEGNMETRQMTPFFIYFFCAVCNIDFCS